MAKPTDIITLRLTRARAGLAANALRSEATRDHEQAEEDRRYDETLAAEMETTADEEEATAIEIEAQLANAR